ncbi:MAG: ADP-forming succinate--CoA ligase subunit beta [Solirubrobacterales bacterium]
MDLLEYQGKQLFDRYDVPVPDGRHAKTVDDAVEAADEIGYPCVIKAQVQIGGRGKAGGIKVAENTDEAREHAEAILGMDIKGLTVEQVWVEAASDIAEEYYASFLLDRSNKNVLAMLSSKGGVDIEEVAEESPEAIARVQIDPLVGFSDFHARRLGFESGINRDALSDVGKLLDKLYDCFMGADATLVEVNPLILTKGGEVLALDSKVTIDSSALYRQPELSDLRDEGRGDDLEGRAEAKGLQYVKLDGEIGILGNGAGLVMSTLDVVDGAGGSPANFLDVGGGAQAEVIVDSLELLISDSDVKAILFNIFGGITRCDEVANGIIEAYDKVDLDVPVVVRLDGTNDKEGRKLLDEADLPDLHVEKTMLEAADRVVELAKG